MDEVTTNGQVGVEEQPQQVEAEQPPLLNSLLSKFHQTLKPWPGPLFDDDFIESLDPEFRYFARMIRRDLRNDYDIVIAITGYPGRGKSTLAMILGFLVDHKYDLSRNCLFIPDEQQMDAKFRSLGKYEILHIDEASRSLHKHKWYDAMQQRLNLLYDVEVRKANIGTILVMPRFSNFNENFRNFRILYWVDVIARGIAVVYRKDEDKDARDPWNIDENAKYKMAVWRKFKKGVSERTLKERMQIEMRLPNYVFWFKFPDLPKHVKKYYLKALANAKTQMGVVTDEQKAKLEKEQAKQQIKVELPVRLQKAEMKEANMINHLVLEGKVKGEIASILGTTVSRVKTIMDKYGLPLRGLSFGPANNQDDNGGVNTQ